MSNELNGTLNYFRITHCRFLVCFCVFCSFLLTHHPARLTPFRSSGVSSGCPVVLANERERSEQARDERNFEVC